MQPHAVVFEPEAADKLRKLRSAGLSFIGQFPGFNAENVQVGYVSLVKLEMFDELSIRDVLKVVKMGKALNGVFRKSYCVIRHN
jgi:hypothetical protein